MFDIQNNFLQSDSFSDIYKGYLHTRNKIKKEWTSEPAQSYIGDIFQGNIHRHGFYFVDNENKLFYDGLFYANKLEGYAQVFYNDGSNFQGLFKDNIRFGPGIFTYPGGEQDVGLWNGPRLLRLGSLNERNVIPRLAVTPLGQLKLLKFRYLVPVCPNRDDIAYTILEQLGANEHILKQSYKLYNLEVENKRNVFFNKKLFDAHFCVDQDCTIEIITQGEDNISEDITKDKDNEEETPNGRSDLNAERVREISEELEIIESRLRAVMKKKETMRTKVEYCRACCSQEIGEEMVLAVVPEEPSEDVPSVEFPPSLEVLETVESQVETSPQRIPSTEQHSTTSHSTGSYSWASADVSLKETSSVKEESSDENIYSAEFSVASPPVDSTNHIQNYLMNACVCDEVIYPRQLYEMEKELEALTNDVMFFTSIKKNLKEKLERHLQKCQKNNVKANTTKVLVKDVLAWNNEDYCMRMLKHSFLHRRSEYMVNFKVSELLAGDRGLYANPGPHEKICTEFLNACSEGNLKVIFKHIAKNRINPNVCDGKGNNGLFFAALNCHNEVIRTLVNLGTKLNQQNDEGLLPLSMSILVYMAERHQVFDWEKSFLPNVEPMPEQEEAYKWYPNMSLLTSLEKNKKIGRSPKNSTERRPYLFNTPYVIPTQEDIARLSDMNLQKKSKVVIEGHSILDAIKTLLDCGANPNMCEAPLPPLILSMFSEDVNLVEYILSASADIEVTTEHEMTCLHIIASLGCSQANVDICSLLLAFSLDPRLKTTPEHWAEQKAYILGKDINPDDVEDSGKNPLHILCMRRDFPLDNCSYFKQMVTVFSDTDIDFSDKYLGHTPLSLAVLVGNQALVETILQLHFINPYEVLDNGMGNIMTIYILRRYENDISPNAKEVLKCLVELGVNPLRHIGEFENAIEFMEVEHQQSKDKKKKNDAPKEVKALKDYLKELSRDMIIKCIQMQAVENLYNLIEDNLEELECVVILAGFLTPFIAVSNLQHLFQYGKIRPDRFDKNVCLRLINMVKEHQIEIKPKVTKAKKGAEQPDNTSIEVYDFNIILDMTDFNLIKKGNVNFKLLPPGLDNPDKYKVCFHCLKNRDKTLVVCPRCQLVYFCSDACNKANLKLRTLHTCNIDFYASQPLEMRENFSEIYKKAHENCEKRWLKKKEDEIELERKKFAEELKSDTYGLKLLKSMKRGHHLLNRTPTMTTLLGSTSNLVTREEDIYINRKHTGESVTNKTFSWSEKSDLSSRKHVKDAANEECTTKQHVGSATKSTIALNGKKGPCHQKLCDCKSCELLEKPRDKVVYKCMVENKTKRNREKVELAKKKEDDVTVRKVRRIPSRYQEFIGLLARYFPDVDFSTLFLPYACYSNGHLYYKFLDNEFYTRTYSMM